jgi:hypothetical protein
MSQPISCGLNQPISSRTRSRSRTGDIFTRTRFRSGIKISTNLLHLNDNRCKKKSLSINRIVRRTQRRNIIVNIETIAMRGKLISATHLKNYMTNDHLVDWLKLYHNKPANQIRTKHSDGISKVDKVQPISKVGVGKVETNFLSYIMRRGEDFETKIIERISENHRVEFVSSRYSPRSVEKTKALMTSGAPFIHSAPVYNPTNNTGGIIDLLVRRDLFSNLTLMDPLSKLPDVQGFTYVVVDIKFSTLPLRSDGIHLINSKLYPAYKAQLQVYNEAIALYQNYTPDTAYILGRKWKYISKGTVYRGGDGFDRLGTINFTTVDKLYVSKTNDAIEWVNNVRSNGNDWTVSPPSRLELYPNMCIDSGKWNSIKSQLAEENKEMTKIWHVQTKHRNNALIQGISNSSDIRLSAKAIGIGGQRGPIIDKIININRQESVKVLPNTISHSIYDWRNNATETGETRQTDNIDWFVDFEVIPEFFKDDGKGFFLFMIGVYYINKKGHEERHTFTTNDLSDSEESRICREFHDLVEKECPKKLWHWYSVEPVQWAEVSSRYNLNDFKHFGTEWCDLLKVFQSEPVVVKGAFNFSLKSIAKALYNHGLIQTHWGNDCTNGKDAMMQAWNYYKSKAKNTKHMITAIEEYNQIDCEMLYSLLMYLRKNH